MATIAFPRERDGGHGSDAQEAGSEVAWRVDQEVFHRGAGTALFRDLHRVRFVW